jgi:hypothetical protein
MPTVYTALWTLRENDVANVALANKTDNLTNVALVADTNLKIRSRVAGGGYRMLIVPEYYLADVGAAGVTALSRDDKHATYRMLENLSKQVPELVIVAGTIFYEKGSSKKKAYSVCPVLKNGKIIQKLYKSNDDGVYGVNGEFRTKTNGGRAVPIFTVNGVSIGLDICMDYNAHRMDAYVATNGLALPDIHVQISGSNMSQTGVNSARVGGVYVHCDLGTKGANAWRVTARDPIGNTAVTLIVPDEVQNPPGGGSLKFYTLAV